MSDADTTALIIDASVQEITVDLLFPIRVGRGDQAREIRTLVFRRATLGQMREIERVQKLGNGMAAMAEIVRQLGRDAENPNAVLLPGQVDQLDVADVVRISEATLPFLGSAPPSTTSA